MPVLIKVLQNDRMDPEILKSALETLTLLCTCEVNGAAASPPTIPYKKNNREVFLAVQLLPLRRFSVEIILYILFLHVVPL